MSIRLRLTLLYSAILALTLFALGSILYATQRHTTFEAIRSSLVRQVGFVAKPGERPLDLPMELPPEGDLGPGAVVTSAELPEAFASGGYLRGRWTQIISLDGTVIALSPDLSGAELPLSEKGLEAVKSGVGWFETAQVNDEPLLIYSRQYITADATLEIVQVAFPISQPLLYLATLRLILAIGSGVVLLAAFAVGWVLAGAALRPIDRIRRTAQAIGAERNFSRRVEHGGPADEVGQLAVTFNQMLAELESGYRQLEAALLSQRRFVADASHELRTPLTTVRGNIELLRHELLAEGHAPSPKRAAERAEILSDTTDEVERLIRLVNQLLTLARADAGQTLQCEPVALRPLLDDVCRQARLITPGGLIHYDPPSGEALVWADRDALKQVLLILIDNAHVHTAPGTVIGLSAAVTDGSASIVVRDTGPGIAPDVLPHIFERFYRSVASRNGAGVGLGLAIARELVQMQEGTISVESQVGQGTAFSVTLRLTDLPPAAAGGTEGGVPHPHPIPPL